MNEATRKKLKNLQTDLDNIRTDVQRILAEEQDKMDNMPESLSEGPQGEALEQAINTLEELDSLLEDAVDKVDEIE